MCQHSDKHITQLVAPGLVGYLADEAWAEYDFIETSVTNATFSDGMEGVSIKLVFQRKIFSLFMTVYIPTNLIVFVSYLTTFFNNKQWFGHIITINLTVTDSIKAARTCGELPALMLHYFQAMLLVTTMLTSIANDLPRTAGIKYIDFWMLFCLLIPVMEIILHTIEDHLIRKYIKV